MKQREPGEPFVGVRDTIARSIKAGFGIAVILAGVELFLFWRDGSTVVVDAWSIAAYVGVKVAIAIACAVVLGVAELVRLNQSW